jgi:hypothetical protein
MNKFNIGDVVTVDIHRGRGRTSDKVRGEYFNNLSSYEFTIERVNPYGDDFTYFFGEEYSWGAWEDEIQLVNDSSKLEDFL